MYLFAIMSLSISRKMMGFSKAAIEALSLFPRFILTPLCTPAVGAIMQWCVRATNSEVVSKPLFH